MSGALPLAPLSGDIALTWDPLAFAGDFMLGSDGDLALDAGLRSAVIMSLLTWRLAAADDLLPDGTDNRRGWFGDDPLGLPDDPPTQDYTGSRLWLLSREKQTDEVARRAEFYAREALAWMIDDGIADRVVAVATFPARGWLTMTVTIYQAGAQHQFDVDWQMTMIEAQTATGILFPPSPVVANFSTDFSSDFA
jgi:phage gp46-like protein